MKITNFSGGLNTRVASELINSNEAVLCENVDLSSNFLAPIKSLGLTEVSTLKNPYYNVVDKTWWPDADLRSYLNYKQYLYWTDGSIAKKYLKGQTQDLGIDKPILIDATLGGAGNLTGTIQYVYTYYNSLDGTESQPSLLSPEVVATSNVINVALTASADSQVTNIFLYRIGGGLTSYVRVAEEQNITQLYTDNLSDIDAVGPGLDSTLNGKAPFGLKYLTEGGGIFFGVVGSRLYFSRPGGNPNYWTPTDYLEFNLDITGIGITPNGLAVFTKTQTFLVVGNSNTTFRSYLISGSLGCTNHKTIVQFNNSLLFISLDGVCSLVGSKVTVISKFKLGKIAFDTVNAVVYDEAYLCQLADNSILVLDLKYTPAFKYYNLNTTWLAVAEDTLYGYTTALYPFFTDTPKTYLYQTGNLTEGNPAELKIYSRIYFAIKGVCTVTVYLDEQEITNKTFTNPTAPVSISIPQDQQRAMSISFKIEGTAIVKQIVYPVKRAENA